MRKRGAGMNILLLGSGGREHALAWKLSASPLADRLYCAPGNAGIARECEVIALDIADHAAVIAFCRAQKIDLVVVGPEGPLCAGIVDDLAAAGIKAFGPTPSQATDARSGLTRDFETNSQRNEYLLNRLIFKYEYGEDVKDVFDMKPYYDQITVAALRDAARMYLNTNRYVKVTLLPETK